MLTPHPSLQSQIKTGNGKMGGTREVTESKLLRLIFHDCIPYADGSGGCDGCLNWKNQTGIDERLVKNPSKKNMRVSKNKETGIFT